MRRLVYPILLSACAGEPGPSMDVSKLPTRPFNEDSGATAIHLSASTAELLLAESSRPVGVVEQDRWELGVIPRAGVLDDADGRSDFAAQLPFRVDAEEARFRPQGMDVFANGEPLAFDMSPLAEGHTGWRVKDGTLLVTTFGEHDSLELSVRYDRNRREIDRLNRDTADLPDAEFAHWTVTHGNITSNGLLLPSPSQASWTLHVPEQGVFVGQPERLDGYDTSGTSDGAVVRLIVTPAQGAPVTVSERRLGAAKPWSLFSDDPQWRVGLERWAGQEVTLTLQTDTAGTPDHDYVYVGAPIVYGAPAHQPRRVVVIAVDTLRPDHMGVYGYGRDTTPDIDAVAAQGVVFDNSWAPAPRTRPSFRSAFTGRGALDAVGAPNTAERFQEHGWSTAGIVSNIHLSPRFGFTNGFDHWELASSRDAEHQVDAAVDWLHTHRHEDTFLFLHFMDPHLFYKPPAGFDTLFVDVPDPDLPVEFNRWTVLGWDARGLVDQRRQDHMVALYDGEIAYMSEQIGRFLDQLDALGDNSLVVFHTDHGEEFWEHDGYEHNHALWNEVVRTALWMRPPPSASIAPQRLTQPVALWDISPTVLDLAGLPELPTDGRSLVGLMQGSSDADWDRPLPLGHLMYDQELWGVVVNGHKYVLRTADGNESLYDLQADPTEQTDIARGADLVPFRQALAQAHGMAVTRGWRIELDARGAGPITWNLPAPALAAWVVDPEASSTSRANKVWGEIPDKLPEHVADVALDDDRTTLTITPGSNARGTIAVAFDPEVVPGGTIVHRGQTVATQSSGRGLLVDTGTLRLRAHRGTVVRPPPDEAARMSDGANAADDVLRILEELGYVGGGR